MEHSKALTVEVKPDLHLRFERAAAATRRAPDEVLRELIENFVERADHEQEYDAWFRREVEAGLREAADPSVKRVPHSEIAAEWALEREHLRRRIDDAAE